MELTITIEGRQAIPVRAIPLLIDWNALSPDQLARILAGEKTALLHLPAFENLRAYQLIAEGTYTPTSKRWWHSYVVRPMQAASEQIEATQISHEVGYQQWRRESLPLLPAGVFVWRDEFEPAYLSEYGPKSVRAFTNREYPKTDIYALNYSVHVGPSVPEWMTLVLEGFTSVLTPDQHHLARTQTLGPAPDGQTAAENGRVTDEQSPTADGPQAGPESAHVASPGEGVMSRDGLVKAYRAQWPTIEKDLNKAAENGLAAARRTSCRPRGWDEGAALKWARSQGKFIPNATAAPIAKPFDAIVHTQVHRLKD